MSINFDPLGFYSRQARMREIGSVGQTRLHEFKVAIVGLGGLGSFEALLLALAGVGEIRLIDDDIVALENLHRSPIYTFEDIGVRKVYAAGSKLKRLNPEVKVVSHNQRIMEDETRLIELLRGVDCVLDGLDNFESRRIVNRYCARNGTIYVYAGVQAFEGNVSVFRTPGTACLECLVPESGPDLIDFLPRCDSLGVIGTSVGGVASIASTECLKLGLGLSSNLFGRLLAIDLRNMDFNVIDIQKNPECPVCGRGNPHS